MKPPQRQISRLDSRESGKRITHKIKNKLHTRVEKERTKCKDIFLLKCKPNVQREFCAESGLLDNLVAEDRHEIGCESLESHFHKDCWLAAGTNKGVDFCHIGQHCYCHNLCAFTCNFLIIITVNIIRNLEKGSKTRVSSKQQS